ncbi:hypothetical protein GCM10010466_35350 [Planomonospora alba]|uniref:Tn3 transposase DDE domain-containing protein n=1 Tax=Planomonospora alba TaxID=161354 RepID=A0ABP6N9X6_9ACTN
MIHLTGRRPRARPCRPAALGSRSATSAPADAGILDRLDESASRWHALAVGQSLTLDWPWPERRDGHPTALGEAIASYGRIFKTLHILAFIDVDETYRRDIKDIRNLQENRHSLARKICHGKKGELYHRYERGLENQLGALGLVLNCVTLWDTVYLDAAVRRLKAQGYVVRTEDMARLSPFVHSHLGVHGTYTFALPDLAPGAIRDLRNPDAEQDDEI